MIVPEVVSVYIHHIVLVLVTCCVRSKRKRKEKSICKVKGEKIEYSLLLFVIYITCSLWFQCKNEYDL